MSKHQPKSSKDSITISSLGILELNMHLTITKKQLNEFGIQSNNINELSDLSSFLSISKPDLLDQIVLLSNNSLINTLLFINRSFKTKTQIELITTSEIYFSPEHSFFKHVLTYVTDKNYLFILENKISNMPSVITLTLKIIDEDTETIAQKYFTIGKQTAPIDNELVNCSKNLFEKLTCQFSNDYFICSFDDLIRLARNEENKEEGGFIEFFNALIKNSPTIHIITLFLNESLLEVISDDNVLTLMKDVIDYSDIVIADRSLLQSFYKLYAHHQPKSKANNSANKSSNKSHLANCSIEEAIIQEAFDKKRLDRVKITVLIERLKAVTIIMQESYSLKVLFNATHIINTNKTSQSNQTNSNSNNNNDIIVSMHLELLTAVFTGGFLSRLLHFKTFNTCLVASNKVTSKVIDFISLDELETNSNKEAYEVVVHILHNKNNKGDKQKEYYTEKRKGFVLDCLNQSESQLKPYNAICDYNCANFLNSKFKWSFLKQQGFIDRTGALLKDPQLIRKPFDKKISLQNAKKRLASIHIENRMNADALYMNKTWKESRMGIGMGFNTKRIESPCQLPMMNKTQQNYQRNTSTGKKNKWINQPKDSNKGIDYEKEKERLNRIMMEYENKASNEIRKCNNNSNSNN